MDCTTSNSNGAGIEAAGLMPPFQAAEVAFEKTTTSDQTYSGQADAFTMPLVGQEVVRTLGPSGQLLEFVRPIKQVPEKPPKPEKRVNLKINRKAWDPTKTPRPRWLAEPYLQPGDVTVLAGVGGGCKSSLAISWTVSLVTALPFNGFVPTRPCKVLLLNVEDNEARQMMRFEAALEACGKTPADLEDKVSMISVEGIGTLLGDRFNDQGVNLGFGWTDTGKELIEEINGFKPDVIILDPLVELHDYNENDNALLKRVVAEFRAMARSYDAAMIIVHHFRKDANAPAGDPNGVRGAGVIVGAARQVFTLTTMSEADADACDVPKLKRDNYVRLDQAKGNYGKADTYWFEKTIRQVPNETWIMALEAFNAPSKTISSETLAKIAEAVSQGTDEGPWAGKMGNTPRSLKMLLEAHGVKGNIIQAAAVDALKKAGYTVRSYKKANRDLAKGWCSPTGLPEAKWVHEAGSQLQ